LATSYKLFTTQLIAWCKTIEHLVLNWSFPKNVEEATLCKQWEGQGPDTDKISSHKKKEENLLDKKEMLHIYF